jgi:hypothetical protein
MSLETSMNWSHFLTTTLNTPFVFVSGKRFEPINVENAYKVIMKLTINSVSQIDFGSYRCVSKNSLGDTDGSIKLYRKYETSFSRFMIISHYLIITHNVSTYVARLLIRLFRA